EVAVTLPAVSHGTTDGTVLADESTGLAAPAPVGPVIETIMKPGPTGVSLPLRLIVGLNRAFEYGAGCFGPPGRWLSGPLGKTFLGWTGLAFLVAAGAWL